MRSTGRARPALSALAIVIVCGAARSAAASDECVGKELASLALAGCPGTICSEPSVEPSLRSLTDLRVGEAISAEALARASKRLRQTGFFKSVSASCAPSGGGVALRLKVEPNSFVSRVAIEGNHHFHESELRKRVFLRPGTILNLTPGQEAANDEVDRQIDSLRRMYRKAGLEGVSIQVRAERVSSTALELTIVIEEGTRQRIREVLATHTQSLTPAGLGLRCPQVPHRTIEEMAGVSSGDVVTTRTRRNVEQNVKRFFQSIGFHRPRVEVTPPSGDAGTLTIEVVTERCYLLRVWSRDAAKTSDQADVAIRFSDPISGVVDSGIDVDVAPYQLADFDDWRTLLPFGESGIFDREEAARGVDAIYGRLESQGYLFADVTMEQRQFRKTIDQRGRDRTPVLGTIDYFLTLNYERRVQAITLEGAKSFDRDELLGVIDTNVYDFFGSGGHLQVDRVLFDLKKLKAYYAARGFYQFRYPITGAAGDQAPRRIRSVGGPGGEWMVWEYAFRDRGFRVRKRRGDLGVYLRVPLIEGPRTRVGDIHVVGADEGKGAPGAEGIKRLMSMKAGGNYGSTYLAEDIRQIRKWYRQRGYHQVQVTPSCRAYGLAEDAPPEDALRCNPQRVRAASVDLTLTIEPGPQIFVGEVFWRGNFKTDADILTRDLPEAGAPYDQAALIEATRKMRNLGVFNSVRVDPIGLDEDPPRGRIGLVVVVEEAGARFIDFAVGFRSINRENIERVDPLLGSVVGQTIAASDRTSSGLSRALSLSIPDILLVVSAQYLDQNFLGRAYELRIPIEYGASTRELVRLLTFKPSWATPRLFDTDVRLRTTLKAEYDRVTNIFDKTQYSGEVTATVPIDRQMSVSVTTEAGVIRYDDPAEPDTRPPWNFEALTPLARASVRWNWDNQDNPLHPTRGFAVATSFSGIFAREIEVDQTQDNAFFKWEASFEGAISTRYGPILAVLVRYGGSDADAQTPLPLNERFTLGGSNGLRGFDDNAVGLYGRGGRLLRPEERGNLSVGGNVLVNGNLELRVPMARSAGLWFALFGDMGALAAEHDQLYFFDSFRYSVGVGLRYLIGNQIPLRIDWGFIISPRCRAYQIDDPDASCIKEEPTDLHFGFLYPF